MTRSASARELVDDLRAERRSDAQIAARNAEFPRLSFRSSTIALYLEGMLISSVALSALLAVSDRAIPVKELTPIVWSTSASDGFSFAPQLHQTLRAHDTHDAVITLPVGDLGELRLALHRFLPMSSDARVEVGVHKRAASKQLARALREVVHFDGSVEGVAHSSCYLAFGVTGAAGWIDLGEGRGRFALRSVAGETAGLCAGTVEFVRCNGISAPDVALCGGALHADEHAEGGIAGFGAVPPGGRRVVELAVDCDYDAYRIFNNAYAATEYIGVVYGAVSAIYRRDCDATIALSYIRLQTDPADLFNESDPLSPFRTYWNENGSGVDRDLFTLFTGRRDLPYGGVAYINAACENYGYSVTGYMVGSFADAVATNPGNWDINVIAHELGHNLGTYHTHDYGIDSCNNGAVQRGTIMSYCHVVAGASSNIDLYFHRGTAQRIEDFLVNASCLTTDCDDDGLADAEEIAAQLSLDGNGDGILDACQDCNSNGVPDPTEIMLELLADADGDMHPDICESDCNANGVSDSIDVAVNPSIDANGDFVLDACEVDCDNNGVADSVDINTDMTRDRSRDGRLDACEDCDSDEVRDFIELQGSKSRWVASANDALLRELDPRSGVLRRTVVCGATPPTDLAIGSDGRLYASVGNRIYALDRVNDAAASVWSIVFASDARAIAVAPSGELAVLLADGSVELLNANGSIARTLSPSTPPAGTPFDLVFRTHGDGSHDALLSFSAGMIRKVAWPNGAGSVFVDATATGPDFRGMFVRDDESVLVLSNALSAIMSYSAVGVAQGVWDVENGLLLTNPSAMCDARDGRAVLVTGTGSASTINGYNLTTGYTERTYRVYASDAPAATAIVIAPASVTDVNGNLTPDSCEGSPADLNGDGSVTAADLAILLSNWGSCVGCAADFDGNGFVDAADLSTLLSVWS